MKKRMFLTTVLMTLVLLLAVTTATFAWYAAVEGNVSGKVTTEEIVTSSNTYTVGALKIEVVFNNQDLDNLGPVGEDGSVQFRTSGNNIVISAQNGQASTDYYEVMGTADWSLKATITTVVEDEEVVTTATADQLKAYAGTKFTVSFGGTNLKVAGAEPTGKNYVATDAAVSYTVEINANGEIVAAEGNNVVAGTLWVSVVHSVENPTTALELKATVAEA